MTTLPNDPALHSTQDRYNAFHILTKPIGPICNLDCKYCFYLEKEKMYPETKSFRMSDELLENYVRQYIQSQNAPEISFAWQGGEPTLMGVNFFRRAVELQRKYAGGKQISNALQTNGVLLNDEWCAFFKQHQFLIGLSIDGPRSLHDKYRVDKGGKTTFDAVMAGMECLKRHRVDFNTLTVVHKYNQHHALEIYRFLRQVGSGHMQFIPIVERMGDAHDHFAAPPEPDGTGENSPVTQWSVTSEVYGDFLCSIFDEWVRNDVGRIFVQMFEVQLAIWMGQPSSLCIFSEKCGKALAMEHNGDLYSCDHYVYPKYKIGNINATPMNDLIQSAPQKKFGSDKLDALPKYCLECDVRFACNGECPKHRFIKTPDGEEGLNYLCAGYKKFFRHIDPYMKAMCELLNKNRSPAGVMAIAAREDRAKREAAFKSAAPNAPCPCGSGKKFKQCCMR
jgi:uncharacterized protein